MQLNIAHQCCNTLSQKHKVLSGAAAGRSRTDEQGCGGMSRWQPQQTVAVSTSSRHVMKRSASTLGPASQGAAGHSSDASYPLAISSPCAYVCLVVNMFQVLNCVAQRSGAQLKLEYSSGLVLIIVIALQRLRSVLTWEQHEYHSVYLGW